MNTSNIIFFFAKKFKRINPSSFISKIKKFRQELWALKAEFLKKNTTGSLSYQKDDLSLFK